METLREAYRLAKGNNGAPGIDRVTFDAFEAQGVGHFIEQLRKELIERTYRPLGVRKVGIAKEGGEVRTISIPAIRDRLCQASSVMRWRDKRGIQDRNTATLSSAPG